MSLISKNTILSPWALMLGALFAQWPAGCSAAEQSGSSPAEVSSPSTSAPADSTTSTVAQVKRDIVKKAELTIRVKNIAQSEKDVTNYVGSIGGFVGSSESNTYDQTLPKLTMVVRVPVGRFDAALDKFEAMGTRLHKTVSAEDVTAQLVDQDARLKTMLAQEEALRNILRSSRKTADLLEVQRNLMELRGQIESLAAQRKALAGMAALSTISLELTGQSEVAPVDRDKDWARDSWTTSTSLLTQTARGFGSLAIFGAVFAPIWVPAVFVLWWLIRKGSRGVPPTAS